MKILRLVLITSMFVSIAHLAKAQVKIGDDPLEIAADRQFEIQRNDTLFVITDNLTLGRTINETANTLADALMIKLLGYGIDQFGPLLGVRDQHAIPSGGTMSNVFLGITADGQVLETPLRLLLEVDTANAYISMFNEVDTFGTVDLAALDSIFVTDNELIDSLNTIRTLINNSNEADNDTITGNEYIDSILVVGDTLLRFIENQDARLGITNTQEVDLSPIINAQTFYRADGTLDEDRTVDGDTNSLTFNNLSNFNVTTMSGNVDIITDTMDVDGNVTFQDYGGDGIKGTVTTILAVDANGNVIETTADEILSNQVDSTIYNNDGTLLGDRTLSGDDFDLTFDNLDVFTVVGDTVSITTAGNTSINADSTFVSEELQLSSYGTDVSGDYLNVLGVDSLGNVVDVNVQDLLADGVDSTLYTHDGTLTGDRTLSGDDFDLTFDNLDVFTVVGDTVSITTAGNTSINADSTFVSEELQLSSYGTDVSGDYLNVLGVDSLGNVVDVNVQDLLADGVDSTIYNYDGILLGDRLVDGDDFDLTFDSIGVFTILGDTASITTAGNTNINADSTFISEELQLSSYGSDVSGDYLNVLGVDSLGNVVDVNIQDLLDDGVDSTIYTHDGTLTAERYMTMDGKSLHFIDGTDTTVITNDGRMAIGKGSVLQGTGTTNDVRLEVNGDILAIQVHSSSDRRFKKNINPVENALKKVLGLEGVTYDFRTEEFLNRNFPTSKQLGFIAQDIETQLPEVVRTNPDGYKAVDYAKVTALLVEAMKEQQAIIDGLQDKVEVSASINAQLVEEIQEIKRSMKNVSNLDLADED